MRITAGVDRLDINAQTIARTLHAPLQQVSNAELLADLARVPRLARVVGAVELRLMTLRSAILARSVRISSCTPAAK
jgi:hypothetical protein